MRSTQGKPVAGAGAIALALAMSWSWGAQAVGVGPTPARALVVSDGSRAPGERWNTFSAVVTITRGVVDADRRPVGGRAPAARYHWERTQSGPRWKSTMTMMGGARPAIVTPTGETEAIPPDIVRVEDEGDGSGPVFFTRRGAVMRPPIVKDRQRMGEDDGIFARTDALLRGAREGSAGGSRATDAGRGWVDAVLPSAARKAARQTSLQRRFGKALGRVRGMDRYVETSAGDTTELLVDADWSLPLELNVVRSGQLESHASFSYEVGAPGSLVRRAAHVEHVLPRGVRTAMDVELSDVRLEDRR